MTDNGYQELALEQDASDFWNIFLVVFCLIYTIWLVIPFCTFQSQSKWDGCIFFSSWAKCYLPWYRCAEMTFCEQREGHLQPHRRFYATPQCQATYLTWMPALRWYTSHQFHEIAWPLGKVLPLDSSQTTMVILSRNTEIAVFRFFFLYNLSLYFYTVGHPFHAFEKKLDWV